MFPRNLLFLADLLKVLVRRANESSNSERSKYEVSLEAHILRGALVILREDEEASSDGMVFEEIKAKGEIFLSLTKIFFRSLDYS